jgi:hypothetical protein
MHKWKYDSKMDVRVRSKMGEGLDQIHVDYSRNERRTLVVIVVKLMVP